MASEDLINSLWEIANEKSDEEIEINEFQNELINNIDTKIKSMTPLEYDGNGISKERERALSIILNQAKANPQSFGQTQGNKFSVSNSIISKAVKTVKYENQFIPGTAEYNQRKLNELDKLNVEEIILTAVVVDQMIGKFGELSYEEKNALFDNFPNMTLPQKSKFFSELSKDSDKKAEKAKSDEERYIYEQLGQIDSQLAELYSLIQNEDIEGAKKIISENPRLIEVYNEKYKNAQIDSKNISNKDVKNVVEVNASKAIEYHKLLEEMNKYLENNKEVPLELKRKIQSLNETLNKQGFKNNSVNLKEETEEFDKMTSNNQPTSLDSQNLKEESKNEEKQSKEFFSEYIDFQTENLSEAINIYKDYFADLDEETINELKEMDISEIQEGIKDDFIQMKVDGEISNDIYKALNVMLENITEETKDILLDPEKRDAFFEKVQSDIESQKDTELIKDSELIEIFKQASVDLEVGEMQEERVEEVQDNSALLENAHMDTEYIVNGVAMNIDEQWLQFFQDAQERGEDLEEAYENYKKEQEIEEIEARTEQEDKKEDKAQEEQEQEAVIIEEDGTVRQPAEEETELSAETLEVEGNEFFDLTDVSTLKNSKKSKKVAVVEKDEAGNLTNVQIFKPIEFFKQNEVTTHEFEETISELTALTVDKSKSDVEKENEEEIGQE